MINAVTGVVSFVVEKVAQLFMAKQNQAEQGEAARLQLAIEQLAGWANEYLLLVWSYPFISCFVPGLAVYTHTGFAQIELMPDWYTNTFIAISASVFGFTGWQRWRK